MYASTRLIILHIPRERLIYVHGLNTGERKRRELHLGLSAGQGQLEWATTGRVVGRADWNRQADVSPDKLRTENNVYIW